MLWLLVIILIVVFPWVMLPLDLLGWIFRVFVPKNQSTNRSRRSAPDEDASNTTRYESEPPSSSPPTQSQKTARRLEQ